MYVEFQTRFYRLVECSAPTYLRLVGAGKTDGNTGLCQVKHILCEQAKYSNNNGHVLTLKSQTWYSVKYVTATLLRSLNPSSLVDLRVRSGNTDIRFLGRGGGLINPQVR